MKFTEYSKVQALKKENVFLVDGPDGTKTIRVEDMAKALIPHILASDAGALVRRQNILDNWYFADPFNQRRKTEYTGSTYTIDRWKCTNTRGTVALTGAGISLTSTSGGDSYLIERFEHPLHTGPYTFSALVQECEGSGYIQWFYSDGTYGPSKKINGSGLFAVANTVEKRISGVLLQFNASSKITFQAAKLECGLQQTLAHQDADGNWVLNDPPPNKALELAKCQRYQVVLGNNNKSIYNFATGVGISTKSVSFFVPLPVTMRSNAAITFENLFACNGVNKLPITSIANYGNVKNGIWLHATVEEGAQAGMAYYLRSEDPYTLILDSNL